MQRLPEPNMPSFQQYLHGFAAYVRKPNSAVPPAGADPERLLLYRQLMLNNVHTFLDACFPVLQEILGRRRWGALTRAFFANHRCTTPWFREIPKEFVQWLFSDKRRTLKNEPPWLAYLAHYEALELTVYSTDNFPPEMQPDGFALNPSLSLACYPYPVQYIRSDQPVPQQTTWLMVWRDAEDQVKFAETSPLTYSLLVLLREEPMRLSEAIARIAANAPDAPRATLEQAQELIASLRELGVVVAA